MRHLVTSLRYFRFVRAVGGHANDGDYLCVRLRHSGGDDLDALLAGLGVVLDFVDHGQIALEGGLAHVLANADSVDIHVSGAEGNPYEVTEADMRAAASFEPRLDPLAHRIVDPPLANDRCIAPGTWPEFWEG